MYSSLTTLDGTSESVPDMFCAGAEAWSSIAVLRMRCRANSRGIRSAMSVICKCSMLMPSLKTHAPCHWYPPVVPGRAARATDFVIMCIELVSSLTAHFRSRSFSSVGRIQCSPLRMFDLSNPVDTVPFGGDWYRILRSHSDLPSRHSHFHHLHPSHTDGGVSGHVYVCIPDGFLPRCVFFQIEIPFRFQRASRTNPVFRAVARHLTQNLWRNSSCCRRMCRIARITTNMAHHSR